MQEGWESKYILGDYIQTHRYMAIKVKKGGCQPVTRTIHLTITWIQTKGRSAS